MTMAVRKHIGRFHTWAQERLFFSVAAKLCSDNCVKSSWVQVLVVVVPAEQHRGKTASEQLVLSRPSLSSKHASARAH